MTLNADRRYFKLHLGQEFLSAMTSNGPLAPPGSLPHTIAEQIHSRRQLFAKLKIDDHLDKIEEELGTSGYQLPTSNWYAWFTKQLARLSFPVYHYLSNESHPNIATFRHRLQLEGIDDPKLQDNILISFLKHPELPGFGYTFPNIITTLISQYTNAVVNTDELDFKLVMQPRNRKHVTIRFSFDLLTTEYNERPTVCGRLVGELEIRPSSVSIGAMNVTIDRSTLNSSDLVQLKEFPKRLAQAGNGHIELASEAPKSYQRPRKKVSPFEPLFGFIALMHQYRQAISWTAAILATITLGSLYFFFAASASTSLLLIHPANLAALFQCSLVAANIVGTIITCLLSLVIGKLTVSGLIHAAYMATRKIPFEMPKKPGDCYEFDFQESNVVVPNQVATPLLGNAQVYQNILNLVVKPKPKIVPQPVAVTAADDHEVLADHVPSDGVLESDLQGVQHVTFHGY